MKLIYQEFERTIAAGDYAEILLPFEYFAVLESSIVNRNLQVEFIGDGYQAITPIRKGIGISLPDLAKKKVRIWNKSSASGSVTIAISDGIIRDNRLTFTNAIPVTGGTAHETFNPSTVNTVPNNILVPRESRVEVILQNNSTGGQDVWFGDSNVDATLGVGIKVPAGQIFRTNSRGAIWAEASAAGAIVNIWEETL